MSTPAHLAVKRVQNMDEFLRRQALFSQVGSDAPHAVHSAVARPLGWVQSFHRARNIEAAATCNWQVKADKTRELRQLLRPASVQVADGTRHILAWQMQTEHQRREAAGLEASLQDAANMGLPVGLHDVLCGCNTLDHEVSIAHFCH